MVFFRHSKRLILAFAIAGIFISPLFIIPMDMGNTYPITYPVILKFSNDETAKDAATNIAKNIENAKIISINELWQIKFIESKAISEIFYVGHGYSEGIALNHEKVTWDSLSYEIDRSPSPRHFFAVCYSANLKTNKQVLTFAGPIEADIAALTILASYYWCIGEYERYIHFAIGLYQEIIYKTKHPSTAKFLRVVPYKGIDFDALDEGVLYEHPHRDSYGINNVYIDKYISSPTDDFGAHHLSNPTIWNLKLYAGAAGFAALILDFIIFLLCLPDPAKIELWVAAVLGLILLILGIVGIVFSIFVDLFIVDEWACGWEFIKDWAHWIDPIYGYESISYHFKPGRWTWSYCRISVGFQAPLPLLLPEWYGWALIDRTPL